MTFSPPPFLKLPRYRGSSDRLHGVQRVVCLEKIDGANTRIGVPQGAREATDLVVGGRVLLEHDEGFSERAIVRAVRGDAGLAPRLLSLGASLGRDLTLYGETCGGKIQRMGFIYGSRPHLLLFGARVGDAWCSYSRSVAPPPDVEPVPSLVKLSEQLEIPLAPCLYEGPPDSERFDALLDRPSRHSLDQGFDREDVDRTQEGIVIWADPLLLDPHGIPLVAKHKHPNRREYTARAEGTEGTEAGASTTDDFAARAVPAERIEHARQHLTAAGRWTEDEAENRRRLVRRVIQDVAREVDEYQQQLRAHGKKAVREALGRAVERRLDQE